MVMANNIDQSTDTHLSKKYNDVVYDCMIRSNAMGYVNNSAPHYENLLAYYGAVNIFFINTYMLFENTVHSQKDKAGNTTTIAKELQKLSEEVEDEMRDMKNKSELRTNFNFQATTDKCKNIHKLIMYGLQKRNMLVRVSEQEPRGKESINFWTQKQGFMKGGVKGDNEI